jgi:hypothetical protein
MREGKEEAREEEEETESRTSMVRLTGGDKELMGHVRRRDISRSQN